MRAAWPLLSWAWIARCSVLVRAISVPFSPVGRRVLGPPPVYPV